MKRSPVFTTWVCLTLLGALWPTPAAAVDPIYTGIFSSTALSGYDPIAYFETGATQMGSKQHSLEWMGATWRFANAERLAMFEREPEKYAPQYGGYCAYAIAEGYTASSDPEAWKIVDGKLYLNYSKKIRTIWEQDIPGYIEKADRNWPEIRNGE